MLVAIVGGYLEEAFHLIFPSRLTLYINLL